MTTKHLDHMKKEYKNFVLENDLEGKWMVTGMYRYHDNSWRIIHGYAPGNLNWNFVTERIVGRVDGIEYCGELTEQLTGTETKAYRCAYYPAKKQLHIEYFMRGWGMYFKNDYRVEKISDTEYCLYDLFEVRNEPEDYKMRVEIKR